MNHAFVDASWHELPGGEGIGGWGLVLLMPGALPARFQGQLYAPDNNTAELRAVLEATQLAPIGQALSVYTDNQAVIASVGRGRGPHLLSELTQAVLQVAAGRTLDLRVGYAPRTRRHMLSAHELANDARRGIGTPHLNLPQTEVIIEQRAAWAEARLSVRRPSERLTAYVPLDPLSEVPPSAQALLAAVNLAQPGETLLVRRASKIAQALWQRPERALRSAAQQQLISARQTAQQNGVEVQFQGVG